MALNPGQVTVLVPVFNDAENLRYCLRALIRARGDWPVDIAVVDDGSSDATPEIVRQFPVTYLRNERNLGQSWARNYGTACAETPYILFIDSDVVVPENCFQQIEKFITMDKPKGLIGLQGIFALEHPFQEWSSLLYNTLQHLLSRKPQYNFGVNTSLLLIKRQEFINIGGFREDLWFMEDNEFAQRMAAKGQYVLHNLIQFVHRKRVTWSWFIRTHVLGGKMQYVLAGIKPKTTESVSGVSERAGRNRVFLRWLVAGLVIGMMGILAIGIHYTLFGMGIVTGATVLCFLLIEDCLILFKVKPHPMFVFIGILTYMLLPWLIVFGRFIGRFSKASKQEQELWRGRKNL